MRRFLGNVPPRARDFLCVFICASAWCRPPGPAPATNSPMIVLDSHEDVIGRVLDDGDDLAVDHKNDQSNFAKWRAGGVNVVWFSLWVDPQEHEGSAAPVRVSQMIAALYRQVARHPDDLVVCDSASDCRAAVASGKIVALLGIEGGVAINNDLKLIEGYRQAHVRYMTLTWRGNLDWAGSSQTSHKQMGLTTFGRDVVREMNRVGMIVDLSHTSDMTFYDALAVTSKPVILSHSNCRALADHPRNVTDDMLRALKKNGGVVGLDFYRDFLLPERKEFSVAIETTPTLEIVLDQIDHAVKVAGIEHVGIGSDFEGDIEPAVGLESAARIADLIQGLRRRGYPESEVRKIAGENFMRVIGANDNQTSSAQTADGP